MKRRRRTVTPETAGEEEVQTALDPLVESCSVVALVLVVLIFAGIAPRLPPSMVVVCLPTLFIVFAAARRYVSERSATSSRPQLPLDRLRSLAMQLARGQLDDDANGPVTVRGRVRGRDVSVVAPRSALKRAGQAVTLRAPVACNFEARIAPSLTTGELTARVTNATYLADAERRLLRDEVTRDLAALFSGHDVEQVEVRAGEVVVTTRVWRVVPAKLERALQRVASIARALERSAPGDSIPPPVVVPRAGAQAARCPFCREALAAGGEIVACRRCQTRLHDACWRELGRCTATGCTCELSSPATVEEVGLSLGPLPCDTCRSRDHGCTPGECLAPRGGGGWRRRAARRASPRAED